MAGVAVALGVTLVAWAAIAGRSATRHAASGNPAAAASRAGEIGRVPIVRVGSSGGVTWAINGEGMWLTTNGGRVWRTSLPPHVAAMGDTIARVVQVRFADRRHGLVFAVDVRGGGPGPGSQRHSELDWTSDGGRSWHSTVPAGCCGEVSFVTPSRAYSLGRKQLLGSTDGGATWKRASRLPFGFGAPTFVDPQHGVAVTGKGDFFRTADGGRRWLPVRLAGRADNSSGPAVLPAVAAFGQLLVVPADRYFPDRSSGTFRLVVYVSDDGGTTWTARPAPRRWIPVIGTEDAQRFSAGGPRVWFAAARRRLAVTRDAGRSWRIMRPAAIPARWTIGAIDFTSATAGWAIFSGPRQSVLMRTTDGGVHWTPAGPRERSRHKHA